MDLKGSRAKIFIISIIILSVLFLISACANQNDSKNNNKLVVAEQYGLAYAPVQLIKEEKLLEKSEADIEVEWKQLSNTAAIREAVLAGEIDIAFMAIPPFLIAKDKGMDWKIFSGLSQSPLGLMVNRSDLNSLSDFKAADKIVLPQPGSIQHILLSMAAAEKFNKPQLFDNQLISMRHPDAMNSLLAGRDTAAHFASPPYLFLESGEEGIKNILSGREAFGGEFSFIVGVTSPDFYQNEADKYQLFQSVLNTALKKIMTEPDAAAEMLADNYGLKVETMKEYLARPGLEYSSEIKGLKKFINFMVQTQYLTKKNYQLSDLVLEEDLIFNNLENAGPDYLKEETAQESAKEADKFGK